MTVKLVDPSRAEFTGGVSSSELDALAANAALKVLQTSEPVAPSSWPLLDEAFFSRRPDVELRLYGFYGQRCDLAFASGLRRVRRFAADCLMDAIGVEHVARIPALESLSLDVFSLESFDVLRVVNPGLRSLALGQTRSKKPSLEPLSRFTGLRQLLIEGHRKDIEVLSVLRELEEVTLRSVTVTDLGFLRPLARLRSLDLKLGGIRNISAIAGMPSIKSLELWQILGLVDVDVAGQLPGLQHLFLQSLRRVVALPDLSAARSLRRVTLETMRGLRELAPLEHAPALEELLLLDPSPLAPEALVPALRNGSLKRVAVGFGSDRKNEAARELLKRHGKEEMKRMEFALKR
jgi:hypothetical protein